jgi:hypothetical protein
VGGEVSRFAFFGDCQDGPFEIGARVGTGSLPGPSGPRQACETHTDEVTSGGVRRVFPTRI